MNRTAVICLGPSALPVARQIADHLGTEIHGLAKRVPEADVLFDDTIGHLQALFNETTNIIGICAAGILVRALGSVTEDKTAEPAVIALSENGKSIVPLLGGHHGANEIARGLASLLNGHAAITTAGDNAFGIALDSSPEGWVLANPEDAKGVMAGLLSGETVEFQGNMPWLADSDLASVTGGQNTLIATTKKLKPAGRQLIYHPKSLAIGVGCERGCAPDELIALVENCLASAGLAEAAIGVVVSIDVKADEAAVNAVAAHFDVSARFYSAERLNAEAARLPNPSTVVLAEVGCPGVAEGAALAAAGQYGSLIVEKTKSTRSTCAIAEAPIPLNLSEIGRARGHLSVIGLGPGKHEWRSPEAASFLRSATDWVGYGLYLDLAEDLAHGKILHRFDLGAEEDRVRVALELAAQGKNVALICSGDAGIYAMATLVFEVMACHADQAVPRVEVSVAPGISAFQAAAAKAGAPIGHDFCTISLSDLLTSWEVIERRLHAAAEGDFVVAFYNPKSQRRTQQIVRAMEILSSHRPPDIPVIIASSLGRPEEKIRVRPLSGFDPDEVDMLTLVMVGSSETRLLETGDGKTWVYTPRGYEKKREAAE